jgi:hypothetical protein
MMSDDATYSDADLIVLSGVDVHDLKYEDDDRKIPMIDKWEIEKDGMDIFNHPRSRQSLILSTLFQIQQQELQKESKCITTAFENPVSKDSIDDPALVRYIG